MATNNNWKANAEKRNGIINWLANYGNTLKEWAYQNQSPYVYLQMKNDILKEEKRTGVGGIKKMEEMLTNPQDATEGDVRLANTYLDTMQSIYGTNATKDLSEKVNAYKTAYDEAKTTGIDKNNTVGDKQDATTPVIPATPSVSNPYASIQSTLQQSYDYARQNALSAKDKTIEQAYNDYVRATNPYGVEAENLARAGLTSNGGYNQMINNARFNAYANAVADANTNYTNAMRDIDIAKSEQEVNLAMQKYQDEQNAESNAYAKELAKLQLETAQLSDAQRIAAGLWNGITKTNALYKKNNANIEEITSAIKNKYPNMNDAYIDGIINQILSQNKE